MSLLILELIVAGYIYLVGIGVRGSNGGSFGLSFTLLLLLIKSAPLSGGVIVLFSVLGSLHLYLGILGNSLYIYVLFLVFLKFRTVVL